MKQPLYFTSGLGCPCSLSVPNPFLLLCTCYTLAQRKPHSSFAQGPTEATPPGILGSLRAATRRQSPEQSVRIFAPQRPTAVPAHGTPVCPMLANKFVLPMGYLRASLPA